MTGLPPPPAPPGQTIRVGPGLRAVLAPNPSPMTLHGTLTYIVGEGQVAVIDPGPGHAGHLEAILAALAPGESVSHIFVTHAHLDHSPLARPLSERTGAPVIAWGAALAGRSPVMERLAAGGGLGGGEGVDADFMPDEALRDNETVHGAGWSLTALHTPGHFANHICLDWDGTVFSGDHVMGWASSMVSPPDGDMGAYMAALDRLEAARPRRLLPTHGDPVEDPAARIAALRAHRREREAQVRAALTDLGGATASELAAHIYTETPPALLGAAARNVLAHLIDLTERNLATPAGTLSASARFHPI